MQSPAAESADRPSSSKLDCFDAIRGFAALIVVVSHLVVGFWPELIYREGSRWEALPTWFRFLVRYPMAKIWDGALAVALFFALSGFVLSLSYFKSGNAKVLGPAIVRRYPRLLLPVLASILMVYFLLSAGLICNRTAADFIHASRGQVYDPQSLKGEQHHWLRVWFDIAPNFGTAMHQSFVEAFDGLATYNLVLWTMPIELYGSFLVYAFLALFGRMPRRWLAYIALAGIMLVRNDPVPYRGAFIYLNFLVGMAICDLWMLNQKRWRISLPLLPGLGLFLFGWFGMKHNIPAAAIILGATAISPPVQRLLSAPWCAVLGKLSFGIYLLHMGIYCSLGCGLYLLVCRTLGWSHTAGALLASLVTIVVTIIAAWPFHYLVDRSAIRLSQWLSSLLVGSEPASRRLDPAPIPGPATPGQAMAA